MAPFLHFVQSSLGRFFSNLCLRQAYQKNINEFWDKNQQQQQAETVIFDVSFSQVQYYTLIKITTLALCPVASCVSKRVSSCLDDNHSQLNATKSIRRCPELVLLSASIIFTCFRPI